MVSTQNKQMAHKNTKNSTVLVVGATGVLGMEVCRQLAAAGKKVKGWVRTSSQEVPISLHGASVVHTETAGSQAGPTTMTGSSPGAPRWRHISQSGSNTEVLITAGRALSCSFTVAGRRSNWLRVVVAAPNLSKQQL
jgi:NAD(P)-dependent dehydrogenase (short-subunit alcohol dehydrogenase family)